MTIAYDHTPPRWDARRVEPGVRGPALCRLVGITYRQLQHWAVTGLLVPSIAESRGSGCPRLYSAADVAKARMIKSLRDRDVGMATVRRVLPLVSLAAEDGLRWLVMGGAGDPVVVADDPVELARAVADARVAVVLDLHDPP